MKRIPIVFALTLAIMAGCGPSHRQKEATATLPDTNMMRKDAATLALMTAECINLSSAAVTDSNRQAPADSAAQKCMERVAQTEQQMAEKYKDSLAAVVFGRYYLEALQQSDIPQEYKELYAEIAR